MQQLLHQNGLLAIRENGVAFIRNDMKSNPAFVKHAMRPLIRSCQGIPGCQQGVPPDQVLTTEYDGVPAGYMNTSFVGSSQWNVAVYYGNADYWTDIIFASAISGYPATYGPTYIGTNQAKNCLENEWQTIVAGAAAVKTYIDKLKALGEANSEVVDLAAEYSAGEIGALDFLADALAILGFAAIGEARENAAVGFTVGALIFAIWDYLKCETGSTR